MKASANDAVDSNGTMTISGGVMVAEGGAYGEDFHGLYLGAASHSGGTAGRSFTVTSTVTRL